MLNRLCIKLNALLCLPPFKGNCNFHKIFMTRLRDINDKLLIKEKFNHCIQIVINRFFL